MSLFVKPFKKSSFQKWKILKQNHSFFFFLVKSGAKNFNGGREGRKVRAFKGFFFVMAPQLKNPFFFFSLLNANFKKKGWFYKKFSKAQASGGKKTFHLKTFKKPKAFWGGEQALRGSLQKKPSPGGKKKKKHLKGAKGGTHFKKKKKKQLILREEKKKRQFFFEKKIFSLYPARKVYKKNLLPSHNKPLWAGDFNPSGQFLIYIYIFSLVFSCPRGKWAQTQKELKIPRL